MVEIRWIQRFENFKKANENLNQVTECIKNNGIDKIYTMALIQAFEMAFELAWKTIKDYLEYNGTKTDTPRNAIKEAFSANLIVEGQKWIDMMEARNKTSHTYKEEFANQIVQEILNIYTQILSDLEKKLEGEING